MAVVAVERLVFTRLHEEATMLDWFVECGEGGERRGRRCCEKAESSFRSLICPSADCVGYIELRGLLNCCILRNIILHLLTLLTFYMLAIDTAEHLPKQLRFISTTLPQPWPTSHTCMNKRPKHWQKRNGEWCVQPQVQF